VRSASGSTTAREDDRGIYAAFAHFARRLSDGRLALATAAGLTATTLIGLFATYFWKVGLAFLFLAAYGGWAIFDRSRFRPGWLHGFVRGSSAVLATLAALLLFFSALEFALIILKP
jgi:hypothetical protein